MTFKNAGFLSPDLDRWRNKTREKFENWFSLVEELNCECMKILWTFSPATDSDQQLVAALLYCRAIQSFQGSILMAEKGMAAEARTLVRNCAETAIALGAIALDGKFLGSLIEGHDKHELNAAKAFLSAPELRSRFSQDEADKLHARVAEILNLYPKGGPKGVNWKELAKEVGMTPLYNTVYRDTSGDGAHVTINAMNRHVKADADDNIQSLLFGPNDDAVRNALSNAISAIIHALYGVVILTESEVFARVQNTFAKRWKELVIAG